jgi:hypothetical protein
MKQDKIIGLFDLSNKINMASFHIETFHFINLQDNASQRDVCLPCQENIYSINIKGFNMKICYIYFLDRASRHSLTLPCNIKGFRVKDAIYIFLTGQADISLACIIL